MEQPKPWMYGPLELLKHAHGHQSGKSDFDRRIAFISYDNAIEVSIDLFLSIHPDQRDGYRIEKKDIAHYQQSFNNKLDFLESYMSADEADFYSRGDFIYYHKLRNQLYHNHNGLAPEKKHLEGIRKNALWTFAVLFNIDVEAYLQQPLDTQYTATKKDLEALHYALGKIWSEFEVFLYRHIFRRPIPRESNRLVIGTPTIKRDLAVACQTELPEIIPEIIYQAQQYAYGYKNELEFRNQPAIIFELIGKIEWCRSIIENYVQVSEMIDSLPDSITFYDTEIFRLKPGIMRFDFIQYPNGLFIGLEKLGENLERIPYQRIPLEEVFVSDPVSMSSEKLIKENEDLFEQELLKMTDYELSDLLYFLHKQDIYEKLVDDW